MFSGGFIFSLTDEEITCHIPFPFSLAFFTYQRLCCPFANLAEAVSLETAHKDQWVHLEACYSM